MDVHVTTEGEEAVLSCQGRLTMTTAKALREAVETTVGKGSTRVVVDLSEVPFVDSSGLGALIAGLKRARQAGGDLRIAAPGEQVTTVLGLTNLDRVLRYYADVESAREW